MRRASINKRLNRLEQRHAPEPSPVLVLLQYPDGSIKRDGVRYPSLSAALEVLKPADYILATVFDGKLSTRIKDNASQG